MQLKYHMVTIEELVPQEHFLRKLEAVLDLRFVYEETAGLYSRRYGRPPIDPVVMVKYLLVGFLYGIPSERQIEQWIQTKEKPPQDVDPTMAVLHSVLQRLTKGNISSETKNQEETTCQIIWVKTPLSWALA